MSNTPLKLGAGTVQELNTPAMLNFLTEQSRAAELICSVCTGSALLAKAGILDGRRATSNKQVFALAAQQSDKVKWVEAARWVEDDKFFTSSGVSAGMDMTVAIIEKLWGKDTADKATSYTEYSAQRDADHDPFASELNAMVN
ncbi:MAG: DJ-1/PfpI family protein [Congregibacter sp.]